MAGFGTDINNTEFVVTYVSFYHVLKLWLIVLPYAFSFQFLFRSFPKKKRSWIISDEVKMEKDYWELRWAISITGLVRSQEITSVS